VHSEKSFQSIEPNEAELIEKAVKGDSQAFGRLYDMHVDRVYRHIFYRVGNTADTEDLTQQVFIKAWQAVGRFKKMSSPFLAWLMTISNNTVIDFYRGRKNNVLLEEDFLSDCVTPGPEQMLEASVTREELDQAIRRLPPEQQQVVLMRYVEDFSGRETAAAMGKSEEAVRIMLFRAIKRLKRTLEARR
jgi:RNA polymerase sigma-70 factor, ECF subfamily